MPSLNRLVEHIEASGGLLAFEDGHLVIRGRVPGTLLMRVHRHRRQLERWLASQGSTSRPGRE
jgi:hypothetical protein